ncbi:MAG: protein phosphatase 2C domain-containing protein [Defluviitaleaceae bacterium]|nr:protein phosphatase 2C domain-containing protein [Defluviitaleaceae bacterium]
MFFAAKKFSVTFAAASRIGKRERNEDSVISLVKDDRYCFVVADGLGGHGLGDLASKTLTYVFSREFDRCTNMKSNRIFLSHAFDCAQEEILALQAARGIKKYQAKTTAVALSIFNGKYAWGHVGDSRLYRFNRDILISRTFDHSVPQILALSNEISEDEISTHPDRSLLLHAFGDEWDEPKYEISKETSLKRGNSFFLCTDGVWEYAKIKPPHNMEITPDVWLSVIMSETRNRRTGKRFR